jgi:hypothetical protein
MQRKGGAKKMTDEQKTVQEQAGAPSEGMPCAEMMSQMMGGEGEGCCAGMMEKMMSGENEGCCAGMMEKMTPMSAGTQTASEDKAATEETGKV